MSPCFYPSARNRTWAKSESLDLTCPSTRKVRQFWVTTLGDGGRAGRCVPWQGGLHQLRVTLEHESIVSMKSRSSAWTDLGDVTDFHTLGVCGRHRQRISYHCKNTILGIVGRVRIGLIQPLGMEVSRYLWYSKPMPSYAKKEATEANVSLAKSQAIVQVRISVSSSPGKEDTSPSKLPPSWCTLLDVRMFWSLTESSSGYSWLPPEWPCLLLPTQLPGSFPLLWVKSMPTLVGVLHGRDTFSFLF